MDFGPYEPPKYNFTPPIPPPNTHGSTPPPPPPPSPPKPPTPFSHPTHEAAAPAHIEASPPSPVAPTETKPASINKRALKAFLIGAVALLVLIMVPAGSVYYWQGWVFIAIFLLATGLITIYLAKNDPKLLESRMKVGPGAETQPAQKKIMKFAMIGFIVLLVFPAFDWRFSLSPIPSIISIIGDVLMIIGFIIVFRVFQVNSYGASTIKVEEGQKVIDTGPYAIVRHPMYAGALIMLIGIPLALGSWFGFLALIPITIAICYRLLDEERFLTMNLEGYAAYTGKVHWRLIPMIW
jgi:protein-S-isoprenylcysteine O-methyltransferase Ste14